MKPAKRVPSYFEAAPIEGLPKLLNISSRLTISLDDATEEDVPAIHSLMRDCARRGDNVGIEEYTDYNVWQEKIAMFSCIFTIKDPQSNTLEGGLLITQMEQARSVTPGSASVLLYLSENLNDKGGFQPLMLTAEKICEDLKLRYFACVYSVFICFQERIQVLRDSGYNMAGFIPFAGEVRGHRGMMESVVMVKEFGPRLEPYSRQLAGELTQEHGFTTGPGFLHNLPTMNCLPTEFISRRGTRLIIRNAQPDDHHWMFDLVRHAADSSDGYSLDSFPSFEWFKIILLNNSYSLIVEMADTRKRTSFLNLSTAAAFSRATKPVLCDCNMAVDVEFRGLGLGYDLFDLWISLAKELGYKVAISDVIMTNTKMMSMIRKEGFVISGTLPRSCFMRDTGWTDTYLFYRSLENVTPFTKLRKERQDAFGQGRVNPPILPHCTQQSNTIHSFVAIPLEEIE